MEVILEVGLAGGVCSEGVDSHHWLVMLDSQSHSSLGIGVLVVVVVVLLVVLLVVALVLVDIDNTGVEWDPQVLQSLSSAMEKKKHYDGEQNCCKS